MSRQNKQIKNIARRIQVTAVHTKAVANTGQKRTMQPFEGRACVGFTKKLTSINKGRCKVIIDRGIHRRVSISAPTHTTGAE